MEFKLVIGALVLLYGALVIRLFFVTSALREKLTSTNTEIIMHLRAHNRRNNFLEKETNMNFSKFLNVLDKHEPLKIYGKDSRDFEVTTAHVVSHAFCSCKINRITEEDGLIAIYFNCNHNELKNALERAREEMWSRKGL